MALAVVFYVSSFDFDDSTNRIYWLGLSQAEGETGFGIDGVDAGGTNHVSLVTLGQYTMSNLLVEGGFIYYVTQDPYALLRIKADGSEPTPTTLLSPTAKPYAIAVDPADGTLYWVEHEDDESPRIMRAVAGATAGSALVEGLPEIDPNGFFFYRP
jgi:outer membrane protein assembly factor BamB